MSATPKPLLGTWAAGSTHMVGDGFHVRHLFPSGLAGNALGEPLSLRDRFRAQVLVARRGQLVLARQEPGA